MTAPLTRPAPAPAGLSPLAASQQQTRAWCGQLVERLPLLPNTVAWLTASTLANPRASAETLFIHADHLHGLALEVLQPAPGWDHGAICADSLNHLAALVALEARTRRTPAFA